MQATLERRYLCPACRKVKLAVAVAGGARCEGCAYATQNLLDLVPVRGLGAAEMLLGVGVRAIVRAAVLVATCAGLAALVVIGR